MSDLEGQQLGNYSLTRKIGEGAFAEVYVGEHIRLNTLAAIKVLLHTRLTRIRDWRISYRGTYCCQSRPQKYCEGSRF